MIISGEYYQKKLRYIPELDGVRGFAILAVMAFHAGAPFLTGGFIGVDIFFVLSGFLITSIIINEYDSTTKLNLKNFYIRRLIRLAPALILLLFTFIVLSFIFLSKDKTLSNIIDSTISLLYMSNWARAFSIHPPDYLGHTWSLSIEEQFYFFWPLTLLLLLRTISNRWTVAAISFSIALLAWSTRIYLIQDGASYTRLYNGLDTRADALMIGCVIGIILSSDLLSEKSRHILSRALSVAAPLSVLSLIFISHKLTWKSEAMYYWIFFAIEILTALLILSLCINKDSLIHKLFSMKWLVWIGSISYSLYLWHYPIYRAMKESGFSFVEIFTLGTTLTFIISISSFYLVEKPILRTKNKYSYTTSPNKCVNQTN